MKAVASKYEFPIHSLEDAAKVAVHDLGFKNSYDYTQPHRHTYFELFLIESGGGTQLIDFIDLPILNHSFYIVFPQQIHLLKRNGNTSGSVIQFSEESIPGNIKLLMNEFLHNENPSVIFQEDKTKYTILRQTIIALQNNTNQQRKFFNEINLLLLQQLLLQVLESNSQQTEAQLKDTDNVFHEFIKLLEDQFSTNHSVQKYVGLLNTTDKKLAELTKKHLGLTPLQVIHNRLLLEIKRLLGFDKISHKEVAYRLGFDNPMRFSQFVKTKTGHSPSELQQQLSGINK
jgi:AraC family transcriptional activator of pobA